VRVHERIQEGGKERIQVFEGLVISVHKGLHPADTTFTVRRIASGVGVEKVFPLHSPNIEKVDVKKVAKVRRAKLFFLRGRRGKAARLSERFTTAGEFSIAAAVPDDSQEEAIIEEKPSQEVPAEDGKVDKKPDSSEKKEEKKEEEASSVEAKTDKEEKE
jgi:large subunit ribosomal protein L19